MGRAKDKVAHIVDVQNHEKILRKRPGEKHTLTPKRITRGEKVTCTHTVLHGLS